APGRERRRDDARFTPLGRDRAGHPREGARPRRGPRVRTRRVTRTARRAASAHLMAKHAEDLQWALQRRLEDVFAKLGEKYGDLTGRIEMRMQPDVSFDDVGGMPPTTKAMLRGFASALTHPETYLEWGITPPKGILLYGPPGTGKTTLARALATA